MGVILSSFSAQALNATSSYSVPIGENQDGDLIVIAWQKMANTSSAHPTATGFSNGPSANNGWSSSGFIYKKNSGGTTASPVSLSFGGSSNITCQSYVIRGVAASPIGANASSTNGGSATATLSAPRVTTTADNSLVLYSCGTRLAVPMMPTGSTFNPIGTGFMNQEVAGVSGADFVATSGAQSPAFDFKATTSASCSAVAMEIKSDGTSVPICVTSGRTVIDYNAFTDASHTWYVPNDATLGISSISGVSMSAYNGATGIGNIYPASGGYWARRYVYYLTGTVLWEGKWESVSVDLTGKVLCVPWARNRASDDRIGSKGMICVVVDVNKNWKAYTLRSVEDGFVWGLWYTKFIKDGVTATLDSGGSGTFDISQIRFIGYFAQGTTAVSGGESYFYIGPVWCEDSPTVFTGGGPSTPIDVEKIHRHLFAANQWLGISSLQGTKQYLGAINHQIGDGTNKTYFKSTGQSLAFRDFNIDYALGEGDVGLRLKGSADCVFDMSSSILAGESLQNFVLDSTSSASATYNLVGASFINLNWSADVSIDYAGASFADCNLVELGGGLVTNATISTPQGTTAATVSVSGGELNGCTIDAGDADYHLTLGTAVTAITLTDVTFSGTTGTTKMVHVLKTTGTVAAGAFVTGDHYEIKTVGTTDFTLIGANANTIGVRFTATGAGSGTGDAYVAVKINTSGTTSIAEADVASAGAVVWVAAPQPTLYATVLANTRTVLWNRTTSAELDNTLVSGTSWSKTITSGASSGDVLDLYAFKEGYAEAVATIIYSGTDATFAIEQTVDPSIDYYRTTESITDYTTLLEFNFYAPDIYIQSNDSDGATSLKRLFIYYNGALTTEDGARYMRGGITFRSAFDVVINRSVVPVAVDNVSATLGLYFTDEATIRVTTDDGTSWIAPPSAPGSIRYAFGVAPGQIETGVSGLTGPESAQLMALPSANATANATITAAVDGTTTLAESIRLHNAILAGKVSGAGTGTETFRDLADTKDRVVVSTDADGNRLAVTKDVT